MTMKIESTLGAIRAEVGHYVAMPQVAVGRRDVKAVKRLHALCALLQGRLGLLGHRNQLDHGRRGIPRHTADCFGPLLKGAHGDALGRHRRQRRRATREVSEEAGPTRALTAPDLRQQCEAHVAQATREIEAHALRKQVLHLLLRQAWWHADRPRQRLASDHDGTMVIRPARRRRDPELGAQDQRLADPHQLVPAPPDEVRVTHNQAQPPIGVDNEDGPRGERLDVLAHQLLVEHAQGDRDIFRGIPYNRVIYRLFVVGLCGDVFLPFHEVFDRVARHADHPEPQLP
mmetsp:Transcript_114041/g.329428  ORF Transcript_114041/g.329428 Transcript_114041/m.329428 type:complete len:287 (+) Transcript_114041:772-1632(+)